MDDKMNSIELPVSGMTCTGCAAGIEKRLQKLGLEDAVVNLSTGSAQFTLRQPELLPHVIEEIERLGYKVPGKGQTIRASWSLGGKFVFSLIWTLPLLLHMFWHAPLLSNPWFQLAVCLPVFLLGTRHFGTSAIRALRAGSTNMDVLIAISITAAFVYSLYGTLTGQGHEYLFYETSATIVTIVLFGNLLEERAVKKTTSAIEELSRMQPVVAKRIKTNTGQQTIEEVQASKLATGDMLAANSGDRIACDGRVVRGHGSLDQSMLTGESVPIEIAEGAMVAAGTVLVSGNITFEATAVGDSTVLANMIRLVKQAQTRRPAIQRLGDRVSAYFVPFVVLFALATLLVSWLALGITFPQALLRSLAVLVIACPCAVGLAIPTAVMAGIGHAARRGILIKGGDTLELFAKIKRAIFDKTGTLTTGDFKLLSVTAAAPGVTEDDIRSLVHGLEIASSHPIARSLVRELRETAPAPFKRVTEKRGLGMEGQTEDGRIFSIGSYSMFGSGGAEPGHDLYVSDGQRCLGWLDLQDELKPGAAETLRYLSEQGIEPIMVSGDSVRKVSTIATALGVREFFAEQLPEEKLKRMEELEQEAPSCFVGDGINDAPALARAHVGVSLSNATEAAIQSARIVLLNGDLRHLRSALKICRATYLTMKQNLFWAFFYNALAIPVAAAGYLSPAVAALSMAFSDIIVVANALRLRAKNL